MNDPDHEDNETAAAQADPFHGLSGVPVSAFHDATLPDRTLSEDEARTFLSVYFAASAGLAAAVPAVYFSSVNVLRNATSAFLSASDKGMP